MAARKKKNSSAPGVCWAPGEWRDAAACRDAQRVIAVAAAVHGAAERASAALCAGVLGRVPC